MEEIMREAEITLGEVKSKLELNVPFDETTPLRAAELAEGEALRLQFKEPQCGELPRMSSRKTGLVAFSALECHHPYLCRVTAMNRAEQEGEAGPGMGLKALCSKPPYGVEYGAESRARAKGWLERSTWNFGKRPRRSHARLTGDGSDLRKEPKP